MAHEPEAAAADQTHLLEGADGGDYLAAAFAFLRGMLAPHGGSPWSLSSYHLENGLREWAVSVGALLAVESVPSIRRRGGMEHDLIWPPVDGRLWKITKNGYFGFMPGLELDLMPEGEEDRRFHLWESGVYHYLDRLVLQNELFGPITRLEGFVLDGNQLSAVTSQRYFDSLVLDEDRIEAWFALHGFEKIAQSAYYRREDNVAVFDAHDKNVTWDGEVMVPFDVIRCRPDGGFLDFIEKTVAEGKKLKAVRTSRTTDHHSLLTTH